MIIPLLFPIINRLRGWDWGKPFTSKGVTSAACGVIAGLCVMSWKVGVIVWLGMWLWAGLGWGSYFDFVKGKVNNEVKWIDWLVSRFLDSGKWNDAVSMSIRGMFIYPMFLALTYIGYSNAWLYGFVGLLQGCCYLVCYELLYKRDYVAYAEVLTGAAFGLALHFTLG